MSNTIYMVYETTNLVNGKYYVGKHTCDSLEFDGYLGSGTILGIAIRKHGKDNFERAILKSFDNPDDAYEFERKIVDRIFVKNRNTYNIALGGRGGESENLTGKNNPMYGKLGKDNPNFGSTRTDEAKKRMSIAKKGKYLGKDNNMYGKTHSQEARKKISGKRNGSSHYNDGNSNHLYTQKQKDNLSFDEFLKQNAKFKKGRIEISYTASKEVTCPHCGKIGSARGMKVWHFDKCKHKKLN